METDKKNISYIDKHGVIKKHDSLKKKEREEFDYARYLNLGFYLVTPLLAGLFIGLKIDEWLHTKPLFLLICMLLGTIATFYNLIKLTSDTNA